MQAAIQANAEKYTDELRLQLADAKAGERNAKDELRKEQVRHQDTQIECARLAEKAKHLEEDQTRIHIEKNHLQTRLNHLELTQ